MSIFFCVLSLVIAGLAEGVMDHLQFHYTKPNQFWNPNLSWRNKYKDGEKVNGPKFWLSTTILVSLTDGWHLMKSIRTYLLSLAVIFMVAWMNIYWLYSVAAGVAFMLIFKIFFTLIYNLLKST